jgi:transposase
LTEIRRETRLQSGYVQQCRDQALWMWRSHYAQKTEWMGRLRRSRGIWREKLLEREPKPPFYQDTKKRTHPRIDTRTGRIESSRKAKLSSYVLRLTTLKRKEVVIIPLNTAEHHITELRKGRIVDFQLLKKHNWFYAHVCVKYGIPDRPIRTVMGVDLGVRRAMATVLLIPHQKLHRRQLIILRDGEKRHRLDIMDQKISELQHSKKWKTLKRVRSKRRHFVESFDRMNAIRLSEIAEQANAMIAVGYAKGLQYVNYRGNGKPWRRRMLQSHFSYERQIRYIIEESVERGIKAERVPELMTSRRCHRCGSFKTRRIGQSLFWCYDCGLQYNADWNAAINIGSFFLPKAPNRRATEGLASARDELAYPPMSLGVRPEIHPESRKIGQPH